MDLLVVISYSVLYGLLAVMVLLVLAYNLGLTWSRGYHKGKKEFLDQLTRDHCKKELR